MRMIKHMLVIIMTMSIVGPLSQEVRAQEATQTITLVDQTGRDVQLEAPATEVVVLAPSDNEIIYALGAEETVIGRGTYVDYPEAVLDIPDVGSGDTLNVEEIIALDPELVLMGQMVSMEDPLTLLEEANIPVYVSDANTIEDTYDNIENIGLLLGYEAEAQELIDSMEATFQEYTEKAANQESSTIYYEISPLEFGIWAGGANNFMDELGNMLNLTNIFAQEDGWIEVSEEQVIAENPDIIITSSMPFREDLTPVEEINQREGWQEVTAIAEGKVFQVDSYEFTRPGPRLAEAIKTLYELVYGEE